MKKLIFSLFFAISAWAAPISTITCSGQTVTVNCSSACGIAQYQGFGLTGTSSITVGGSAVAAYNATAATASTSSFTFALPAGSTCAGSSGGTVAPAPQIINTGSSLNVNAGTYTLNYVLWFTVTIPIPINCGACTQSPSAWPNATAAQIAALIAGTTVERIGSITVPVATTASQVEAAILAQYQAAQQPFQNYVMSGVNGCYNGSIWTMACN